MKADSKVWRILLVVLLVGLILAMAGLLHVTVNILMIIFGGILFGIMVSGVSGWITRYTSLPYRAAFSLVLVLLVTLLAGGMFFMGWQIAQQVVNLWSELQAALGKLSEQIQQMEWIKRHYPQLSNGGKDLNLQNWSSELMQGAKQVGSTIGQIGLLVTGVLVVFFVGCFLAFDPHLYTAGIIKLFPMDRRDRVQEVLLRLQTVLGRWVIARLISMSIIGVFTAIGLWIMGVPLPITLGVLAAFLTFIPNLGPILAAVPQALLALEVGPSTVIYVLVFNACLQAVESYVVNPIVQRCEVTLPPALVISVQLLLTGMFGLLGALFGAPITAAVLVIVQMLYVHDFLGDSSPGKISQK